MRKIRRFLAIKKCRFMLWRRRNIKHFVPCNQCEANRAKVNVSFVSGAKGNYCDECIQGIFEWHRKNGKEPQIILRAC